MHEQRDQQQPAEGLGRLPQAVLVAVVAMAAAAVLWTPKAAAQDNVPVLPSLQRLPGDPVHHGPQGQASRCFHDGRPWGAQWGAQWGEDWDKQWNERL